MGQHDSIHTHSRKQNMFVLIIECIENWINWDVMMSNYLIMTRVTLSFEQLIDWKIIEPIEFWIMFKWCLLCSIYYVAFFAKIVVDCDYKLAIVLVVWSVDDYEMSRYRLLLGWFWLLSWIGFTVDCFNLWKLKMMTLTQRSWVRNSAMTTNCIFGSYKLKIQFLALIFFKWDRNVN